MRKSAIPKHEKHATFRDYLAGTPLANTEKKVRYDGNVTAVNERVQCVHTNGWISNGPHIDKVTSTDTEGSWMVLFSAADLGSKLTVNLGPFRPMSHSTFRRGQVPFSARFPLRDVKNCRRLVYGKKFASVQGSLVQNDIKPPTQKDDGVKKSNYIT
ncbi:unnamed protein product [Clavelina lepadiformis]|uniref:Uncharacterized protein n=1 Tax=Clavelina lepadiformis TaxID=159417 RepID=A0ABP0EW01_CLALP